MSGAGSGKAKPQDEKPFLAIVGYAAAPAVEAEMLLEAIGNVCPAISEDTSVRQVTEGANRGAVVSIGRNIYTIMRIPQPVPLADLRLAISNARMWPTASLAVQEATEHYIIAPLGVSMGHAQATQHAADITIISAALIELVDGLFVYWGTADNIVEPSTFVRLARTMMEDKKPPILSWIQFILQPRAGAGTARTTVKTAGLASFVGRELEVDENTAAPVPVLKDTIRVAEYLVREGNVISDGEEIRLDQDRSLRARLTDGIINISDLSEGD